MKKLEPFGIFPGRGKDYEDVMHCMALIYNICNARLSHFLRQYGLSIGKFNILVAIKVHGQEEGLSQVDISKHLIVTPSNMTKLIDKLEQDGMVTRSAMPQDRRVNMIKVTPSTAEMIDSIWDDYSRLLKDCMAGLNNEDQSILAARLIKWLDALL